MSVSRFFGTTTREALRQVRLALGPDALIISNRRVSGGVEILATDQTQAEMAMSPAEPVMPAAQGMPSSPSSTQSAGAAVRPVAAGPDDASFDLKQAVGDLRGLLEARMDEMLWGQHVQRAPVVLSMFQRLLGVGFSTRLLRAMLRHLPAELTERAALEWCRNELIKHLPTQADDERVLSTGAVVALVGPTGVGKTTTIAKLAARSVQKLGAGSVVLITTDTYRIGAHEQLRIYGRLMGVPVHVAEGAAQLAALVREAGPDKLVLIDNIGVSQRDHYVGEQAAMLASASPRVVRLLALNAASHGDTLDEVARRYTQDGGPRLVGCLVTKVDEAGRLAPVLDTCIRYRLSIHYVSIGQKVPEDLAQADATRLVDRALGTTAQAPALYAPSQADLAMLMASRKESIPAQTAPAGVRMADLMGLLAGQAGVPDASVIEAAVQAVDAHLVLATAYDAFQRWQSGQTAVEPAQLLAQVDRTLPLLKAEHVVALSGQIRLPSSGRQLLRACLLATSDGHWLTSPWQCWLREDAWESSDGQSGTLAPPSGQFAGQMAACLEQSGMIWLPVLEGKPDAAMPLPHWLAPCAPRSRWHHEGEVALAVALGHHLPHQPMSVATSAWMHSALGWPDTQAVSWWAATTTIHAIGRRGCQQPLTFFSLKAQRQCDATPLRHWMAVGRLPEPTPDATRWSQWLLRHATRQTVLRLSALHWQWLAQRRLPCVRQAGVATQLALASAYMLEDPQLGAALRALVDEQTPTLARMARATCRLFELKRMLSG